MNRLKTLLLATVCAVTVSAPAFASDHLWSGPYVGVQLGGGTATTEFKDLDSWYDGNDGGPKDDSFVGGIRAGYDWTSGNVLYGVLAEYSFTNIDTQKEVASSGSPEMAVGSKIDGIGSLRGKVGLFSGNVAGTLSAGLAYQNASDRQNDTDGSNEYINSDSDKWGWVFGIGTEYALDSHSSIGLDASHYMFGKKTHEVLDAGVGQNYFFTFENTVSTATVSYNYHF